MRRIALALFTHRLLAIGRWDLHFIALRLKNKLTGQDERLRRFLATRQAPILLNFGSGPRGLDDVHWINLDGFPDRNVHFQIDFGRPLPLPDASVDGVFCEHVIEHFSLQDGGAISREILRILRPGGRFRIIVPDAEIIMRSYFDAPEALVDRRGEATAMGAVNAYFRQGYEHQFLYDWTSMEAMLKDAGFARVDHLDYQKSLGDMPLALDDEKYAWESLYVEGVKASAA